MTCSSNIVKLDIGGTLFKTSKSTLTKFDGFFKTMLETDVPITKDESGAIFIDRSAKHFDKILNFMRDGRVKLPVSQEDVEEIRVEAQYYLLTGLGNLCSVELEKKRAEKSSKIPKSLSSGEIIELNVGGTMFQTTKETLTKYNGYFRTLIYNESLVIRDKNGCIFINRSPKHFEFILSSIINQDYTLPHCVKAIKEIEREALFYGLHELARSCEYQNKCSGNSC